MRISAPQLLAVVCLFGLVQDAKAAETPGASAFPSNSAELFQTDKVWTLHLRFTPEQWAAMEPEGGTGLLMGGFGIGMFLTPSILRDGDADRSGNVSAAEFRAVAERWHAAWDRDGDGAIDAKQIREGLKRTFTFANTDASNADDSGPAGFFLQGPEGQRNGLASILGIDFTYVHGDLEFEGRTFSDVAVRYKGNGTFLESRNSLKRSIKIDLNKYVKGQKLVGVTTLNLHNNITDAGMMNEVLSFGLYRDADLPAPRTAYARVYVTVPGRHGRRYFGLYSLVENVDKNFASDRHLNKDGAIFKPSTPDLFADLGDDWAAYQQTYDPKTDLTDAQKRRVIDLCRLVSKAGDDEFAARLGEFIDLDEFARFMAVSVWIGDYDSLLITGQNFYLYLDPKSNRFRFIPWDKDHTFGAWIAATHEDRQRHSILEPWEGRKRFVARVFKVDAFREKYSTTLAKLHEEYARPEHFEKRVASLAAAIGPAVKEESGAKFSRFEAVAAGKPLAGGFLGLGAKTPTLLMFVKARAASVADQLAGNGNPFIFGKSRPGGPPQPEFKPEEMVEPPLVKSLDSNKDKKLSREEFVGGFDRWFIAWDTDKKGILSDNQIRNGLNKELPFPFFGPPRQDDAQPPSKVQPQ
jgi:hypothetical protein